VFAKIFSQIFDSSIAEDYRVRLVFEDFLKLADVDGVVDMTPEAIARRTNVPLDIVKLGIEALEQPDTRSRSAEHDGRRIIRLDEHRDWGWMVVNYAKYRDIRDELDRKAYRAAWMQEKRREQREHSVNRREQSVNKREHNVNEHEQAVNERERCEPMQKQKQKQMDVPPTPNEQTAKPEVEYRSPSAGEIVDLEQAVVISQNVREDLKPDLEFVAYVHGIWFAQGGKNANGQPVSWKPYIAARWLKERFEWQTGTHRAKQQSKQASGQRGDNNRNSGTRNEGKASQYAGIGRVKPVSNAGGPTT